MKYSHMKLLREMVNKGIDQKRIVKYLEGEGYSEAEIIEEISSYELEKARLAEIKKEKFEKPKEGEGLPPLFTKRDKKIIRKMLLHGLFLSIIGHMTRQQATIFPAHIFREYDIRGLADREIDEHFAYRLGLAFAGMLDAASAAPVIVGRDVRLSGPALQAAAIRGLTDAGRDVIDIGVTPTPLASTDSSDFISPMPGARHSVTEPFENTFPAPVESVTSRSSSRFLRSSSSTVGGMSLRLIVVLLVVPLVPSSRAMP